MKDAALPAGVILAGGRSRRMQQGNKALAMLAGQPLLQHVIDRVRPQVCSLMLSVDAYQSGLEAFGLQQVSDTRAGSQGPLGGLLAAMLAMPPDSEYLLLVPCDAPFLPAQLGARLLQCAQQARLPGCVVDYQGELQPTFSLWHRSLQQALLQAVQQDGLAGFKQFLNRCELARLRWETSPVSTTRPFFNINSAQDLARAEDRLARATG